MFKRIPGTKDVLPKESDVWQEMEDIAQRIFSLYNYRQIRPPLIEEASLFNRSLGTSSEIVQKQMFLIKNKKDVYALRPEGTASIVRSFLENNLDKTSGFTKFYYIGPMFRLERPQKGRLRQFHHIGVEAIGSLDADLDVEVISLADNLLKAFSIKGYEIKINSLGCGSDKKKLIEALRGGLKKKLNKLCPDCNKRYKTNTLRILDCKKESCREVVSKSEIKYGYLCRECDKHFAKVKIGLDAIKVSYELAPRLVRGLDYYTGTVFEIVHPDLGAQDALGAGGRYNNLIKELGGPDLGAVGFAFGVERLLLVMRDFLPVASQGLVYIISLGEEAKMQTIKLLDKLRKNGIASDTDYEGRSLKGAMRTANDLGVRFVIIIGEDEIKKNVVTLKDMVSGTQKEVNADSLLKEIGC